MQFFSVIHFTFNLFQKSQFWDFFEKLYIDLILYHFIETKAHQKELIKQNILKSLSGKLLNMLEETITTFNN